MSDAHRTTDPLCIWCRRPKSEWSANPCSAPDGDGHLVAAFITETLEEFEARQLRYGRLPPP